MGLGMLKYVLGFWVVEQLIPVALSSFCPFHVGTYHEMPQPLWMTSNAFRALRWLQAFSLATPPSAVARRHTPGMLRCTVLWWSRRHCSQMPLASWFPGVETPWNWRDSGDVSQIAWFWRSWQIGEIFFKFCTADNAKKRSLEMIVVSLPFPHAPFLFSLVWDGETSRDHNTPRYLKDFLARCNPKRC